MTIKSDMTETISILKTLIQSNNEKTKAKTVCSSRSFFSCVSFYYDLNFIGLHQARLVLSPTSVIGSTSEPIFRVCSRTNRRDLWAVEPFSEFDAVE